VRSGRIESSIPHFLQLVQVVFDVLLLRSLLWNDIESVILDLGLVL
jgi:hypothetical protein